MKPDLLKSVLVFRQNLLPVSETFILAQGRTLTMFKPHFVGLTRNKNPLQLPADTVWASDDGLFPVLIQKQLYSFMGAQPRIHRRNFLRKLTAAHPMLLHAHFAPDGVAALPLVKRLQLPLVVTLHGYDVTTSKSALSTSIAGRTYLAGLKHLWEYASLFICVSQFIYTKAIEFGFPKDKLRVHHIGVDTTVFQSPAEHVSSKIILFVGRLVEKKGCEYLLHAMSIVQSKEPLASAVIIGDGPLRPELEALSERLGVRSTFLGSQSSQSICELLSRAEMLCTPSVTANNGDSEGLPIVVLEAQAMGVPVVGTLHAGIPEAVQHDSTGLLCAERDVQALANHLSRFLQDQSFRAYCSVRAVERMRQDFNLAKQTNMLESHYNEAVETYK